MKLTSLVIFALFIALSSQKLLILTEFYRHGARGALSSYYDGADQPLISGELTPTGMRQHYNLGRILRQQYIVEQNVIPEKYNDTLLYVRSDDYNRTIMSAYSHFQGIFPQGLGPMLPSNLSIEHTYPPFNSLAPNTSSHYAIPSGIQVIPVHVISLDTDTVFAADDVCPTYTPAQNTFQAENAATYAFVDNLMNSTYAELSQIFNSNIQNWSDASGLIDVIYADQANGRYVPQISDALNRNITFLYEFNSFNSGVDQVRIMTEAFYREIFGYYQEILANQTNLRWLSFSGHDSNVAPLLQSLNLTSQACVIDNYLNKTTVNYLNCASGPVFASNLIFEIHQNDTNQNLYISVRFQGEYMNLCEKQSTQCDFNEFVSRISNTFAPTFQERCGTNLPDLLQQQQQQQIKENVIQNVAVINSDNHLFLSLLLTAAVAQVFAIVYLLKRNKQLESKFQNEPNENLMLIA